MTSTTLLQGRTALVIGHPGHELLVHGWMERTKPLVFVLTDGSGADGHSRLGSTTRVLARTGARPGAIYGRLTDRGIYSLMLDGQLASLTELFDILTRALLDERITCVVGDSAEGYNPTHDLCRLILNAAVARAAREGCAIDNYEFAQVGKPDGSTSDDAAAPGPRSPERLTLDDDALARKMAAAEGYPEMAKEVARAVAAYGTEWCRTECFVRASSDPTRAHATTPPYYETYGAERVAQGLYSRVLRYGEHVRPVIDHLRNLVDEDVTQRCASS